MLQYHKKFKKLLNIKENPSKYELELFKKTQKYIKFISWIPGLKLVGICNSLSMYATKEKGSDIDLFIITGQKRLWLVRILVSFIFQILGVRRHGNKIIQRFCLSFFITENAMDFSRIAIKNDIYLFYWIYYLKPILNKYNTYEHFIEANKSLGVKSDILPKDNLKYVEMWKGRDNKSVSPILDFLNSFFEKIFVNRAFYKKEKLSNPSGIIISHDILKFHNNDRRKTIRDKIFK